MASIHLRKDCRVYLASFRDKAGKLHQRSTKVRAYPPDPDPKKRAALAEEAKKAAREVAESYEAAVRGDFSRAGIEKTLLDLHERATGEHIRSHTARDFLTRWLDRAATTKTEGTLARYKGTVKAFLKTLGAKADAPLRDIIPADVERFIAARLGKGRNPSTVRVDIKTLNAPFALALRQGLVLLNPVAAADLPAGEKEARHPFTPGELAALVNTAQGEWRTAVLLGGFQGLRLGDAVSLKWSNLDFAAKVIRLRPAKTRSKKRDMILPMHPRVEKHLLALNAPDNAGDGFICPALAKAPAGGRSGLSRQFQVIAAQAGIEQETVAAHAKGGRALNLKTFHSLRHTFVTALENAGVAPDQRMLLAGHSDAKSHALYTHTTVENLRAALAKVS